MRFMNSNSSVMPAVVLLHGGGLSWWSLEPVAKLLSKNFNVVSVIIDGHGDDFENEFVSIEHSAQNLIDYIDSELEGHVFAVCGLSLGAQIALEALSRRRDLADFAVIESALVLPLKCVSSLVAPMFRMSYSLIKRRWFARLQAQSMRLPESMFERYFEDSKKMSCRSLINMTVSNGGYSLDPSIGKTLASVLVIAGQRELSSMRKSARLISEAVPSSSLYIAEGMSHGELSLCHPESYVEMFSSFVASDSVLGEKD